ncbi:MAG: lytic transglycosylase domain-containing protein [Gammaproteobacteria bacterium]|nr:lytic transglycosylase domain-containing protein [Gammaproteobacteria bacterium]
MDLQRERCRRAGAAIAVRRTRPKRPGRRPKHRGVRRAALVLTAACAFAAAGILTRLDHDRRVAVALTLPEVASRPTWADERDAFATRLAHAFDIEPRVAADFAGWILEAATRQALPPELLASLVMTESSFRKNVRSSTGAVGPGQVHPDLWAAWCRVDVTYPEENVNCAAGILAHYVEVCAQSSADAEACALRSYNVGYRNRDNSHFDAAADRYLAKIQRYLADLERT